MHRTRTVTARRSRRLVAVTGLSLGALVLGAGAASAHVTVHADVATSGATDVAVTFRTPNEMDNANTTKLDVFLPTTTPLLGVLVQQHAGWTAKATTTKLAKPVKTDDGTITEAVSEVVWTANSAADGLQPGQSADFVITAGQLPNAKSLTFKALQTYSNGKIVRWIEVATPGGGAPANPAPVLDLAAAAPDSSAAPSASAGASTSAAGSSAAPSASAAAPTTSAAAAPAVASTGTKSSSDTTARVLAVLGLIAGVVGIGTGALLGRGRTQRG